MLKLVSTGISTKGVAKHPLYITSNIAKQGQFFTRVFCDRNVTKEKSFKCSLCNCTIFSKKCMRGHKKLCNGKGYFGFKCDQCQKFLTSSKGQTSMQMRQAHICNGEVACRICFEKKDNEHLCKLKHLKMPLFHTRLGFFKIKTFSTFPYNPILMLVLREEEIDDGLRGHFTKYLLKHELLKDPNDNITLTKRHLKHDLAYIANTIITSLLKYQSSDTK